MCKEKSQCLLYFFSYIYAEKACQNLPGWPAFLSEIPFVCVGLSSTLSGLTLWIDKNHENHNPHCTQLLQLFPMRPPSTLIHPLHGAWRMTPPPPSPPSWLTTFCDVWGIGISDRTHKKKNHREEEEGTRVISRSNTC